MKQNPAADYYETNWENYYKSVKNNTELVPWDVAPETAVLQDLERMAPYFNKQIPLIDIGCGLGTQTASLAGYFENVTGTDISEVAIRNASERYRSFTNLNFQTLNIINTRQCEKFVQLHGEANLYMRGTLQQILNSDRTDFAEAVKILLGKTGRLYFIELSTKAKDFFLNLYKTKKEFPASLNRVLRQKVTQLIGVHIDDLTTIFPPASFRILNSGEDFIALKFGNDGVVNIPATYGIVQNNL